MPKSDSRPTINCRWISLHLANAYVRDHHRHLKPPRGAVFALAAYADGVRLPDGRFEGGRLCGVLMLGRPIARLEDRGERWDVTRCATDETPNAASALYATARRIAQAAGMLPPRTHTRLDESGASLRGAGFEDRGLTRGGDWIRSGRESVQSDTGKKRVWSATVRLPRSARRAVERQRRAQSPSAVAVEALSLFER